MVYHYGISFSIKNCTTDTMILSRTKYSKHMFLAAYISINYSHTHVFMAKNVLFNKYEQSIAPVRQFQSIFHCITTIQVLFVQFSLRRVYSFYV